jgi:diguanylate cyclase (GGDEF)-like protein/PAS domain S-box-containing protein
MQADDRELWSGLATAPAAASPAGRWRRLLAACDTLKLRIALATLACTVIGITTISLLSLAQIEAEVRTQAGQRELDETALLAADLSQRVVALQLSLRLTAESIDPVLESMDDALEQHLQAQPALRQQFSALFVAAPDGRVRLLLDDAGARRPDTTIADRAYFRQTVAERRAIVSDAMPSRLTGEPVIVFSHPIVRDGTVTSVIGGALRLSSRSLAASLLAREHRLAGGELIVLSDAEQLIAHPLPERLLQPVAREPRLAQAFADWRAHGSPVEPEGLLLRQAGETVSVAGIAGTRWMVWRALPDAALLAPLRNARLRALRNAALVVGVLTVLSLLWVRRLTAPLKHLEARAARLFDASANMHEGWPTERGEVGALVRVLRHVGAERAQLESFSNELVGRLSSVMAAAPLGIAFTRQRRFELVSAAWAALLGRDVAALVGTPAADIFADAADYEALGTQVAGAFAAGRVYEGEWRIRRADGSLFWGQLRGQPVDAGDAAAGTIWTLADVTALRASREDLEWSALHDPLTGLANRKAFERRLQGAFALGEAALVVIDLDHFKPINDSHGHAAGDAMLQLVARTIAARVRADDLVARLGGDEFAVVLGQCPAEAASRVAGTILDAVRAATLVWEGTPLQVGASVGLARHRPGMADVAEWQRAADAACYDAKRQGRGRVCIGEAAAVAPQDAGIPA